MRSRISILDDTRRLSALDGSGMLNKVLDFPRQCREMAAFFQAPLFSRVNPRNIVFLGLGSSAIGSDLLRALVREELRVPAVVCRDYSIPAFVGKSTLVLAVSYSGNTEEILEAYTQARAGGAKIIAFSSGGLLMRRALEDGVPHIAFPPDLTPRSALGYSFTSLLLTLSDLGLIHNVTKHLDEALRLVEDLRHIWEPTVPFAENGAKNLARRLYDRIPLIYGAGEIYAAVAARWRCQFNENAKVLAFSNGFPELNHNEVVPIGEGFARSHDFFLVILKDRLRKRLDAVARMTAWYLKDKVEMLEFEARGKSPLARMFYHIFLGDIASVYLAALRGVDPTPIGPIDRIKSRMKKKSLSLPDGVKAGAKGSRTE